VEDYGAVEARFGGWGFVVVGFVRAKRGDSFSFVVPEFLEELAIVFGSFHSRYFR